MNAELAVIQEFPEDKQREGIVLQANTLALQICDEYSLEIALEFGNTVKQFQKQIIEKYAPMKKKAKASHQEICDQENADLKPLEEVEKLLKEKIGEYRLEEQRKVKIEQERLLAQQKKEAEEAQLEAAVEAEKGGEIEKAEALLSQPVPIATTSPFISEIKKLSMEWQGEIYDMKIFILQLSKTPEPILSQILNILTVKPIELKRFVNYCNMEKPFPGIRAKQMQKVRF